MSASWAKASVKASASATTVPVDREYRSTATNSGGASRKPTTQPTTRKPTATTTIPVTLSGDTEPSVTIRTTTVRTTRPMTSSATAAPRTTRASVVARARRSPNTRAVMPTLVAVSAAATNSATSNSVPVASIATRPSASGAITPTVAVNNDARPTARNSPRSISRPTSSSRRITPSSPSVWRTSSPLPTRPSIDGPMMMPATISPTTAGTPIRSATSAANLAATITTRMWVRIVPISASIVHPLRLRLPWANTHQRTQHERRVRCARRT